MKTIVTALVLMVVPAAADPHCIVTIARAPDDVRAIVEEWVRAEPSCALSLEVRIVPTDGGLYILANDPNHRVRERIVPDAQSAGVLIASWIADDTQRGPSAAVPPPQPLAPAPAVIRSGEVIAPRAPGLTVAQVAPPPVDPRRRWLSVAGMFGLVERDSWGVRAELDVKTWHAWAVGTAASFTRGAMNVIGADPWGIGMLAFVDGRAIAYVSHTDQLGKWQLREAIGGGLGYTSSILYSTSSWQLAGQGGLHPIGEASLMFGRELGASWAITTGLLATVFAQSYSMDNMSESNRMTHSVHRELDLMFATAVRYRL